MSADIKTRRLLRAVLLIACVPMVLAYGLLSLCIVFPLVSLLMGNLNQAIFLLWWLLGTAGILALVYSSFTFGLRAVAPWQMLGLIAGMLATVPLLLGFFGEWWVPPCAVLADCLAGYILVCSRRRPLGEEAR